VPRMSVTLKRSENMALATSGSIRPPIKVAWPAPPETSATMVGSENSVRYALQPSLLNELVGVTEPLDGKPPAHPLSYCPHHIPGWDLERDKLTSDHVRASVHAQPVSD
jgi:hypothetical protein